MMAGEHLACRFLLPRAANHPRGLQVGKVETKAAVERHDPIRGLIRRDDRAGWAASHSAARICSLQSKPPFEY